MIDEIGTVRGAVIGTLGAMASLLLAFVPGGQVADTNLIYANSGASCGLMSSSAFALVSRSIVTPTEVAAGVIIVVNGRIQNVLLGSRAIQETMANSTLAEIIDVGDSVISPGVIDVHVHLNEPGRSDWEGFSSGTKAAAAGGVTTLIDMPKNSRPVTISSATLEMKVKAAQGKCAVDVGFWGGLTPENANNDAKIASLLDAGAAGLKVFLVDSGMEDFRPVNVSNLGVAMRVLNRKKKPLMVHAEVALPPEELQTRSTEEINPMLYSAWLESRPPAMEREAVRGLIVKCRERSDMCPKIHIAHLSDAVTAGMVRGAKLGGLPFSGETCPHYLIFSAESIPNRAVEYKCAPPIRDSLNRESLWNLLEAREGLEMVSSDHAPSPESLKLGAGRNFLKTFPGISSLQFTLPAMWKEASQRGFSLMDMADILSAKPAALLGIDSRKGQIKAGLDADFVIWNPLLPFVKSDLRAETQHRHKITPYKADYLQGKVEKTFVRGNLVYDNGVFSGDACGVTLRM